MRFLVDENFDNRILAGLRRRQPAAAWSLLDHAHMERELEQLLGRRVDLVSRATIERSSNWIRRKEILETSRPIYAA